jgi:predicted ABC-type ATPase
MEGGHSIPEDVIRRRFESGWKNFNEVYKNLVDSWSVFDGSAKEPTIIEEGENR